MSEPSSPLHRFVAELQRRRVTRTLIGYGVVAFGAIQLADPVVEGLGLPDWVFRAIVVAALAGFPVVAVLSWVFDVRPGADAAVTEDADTPTLGPGALALRAALVVVVVLGTSYAGWRVFQGTGEAPTAEPLAESLAFETPEATALAVLPLTNLSDDPDDAYFAEGLHDEILVRLAQIPDLRLTSRQSVLRFRDSDLAAGEICAALGCRHLAEATAQRSGDRVRVRFQLIEAATDTHVWAETFDGGFGDLFEIQASIAGEVAEALGRVLTPSTRARLARHETENEEAYDLYLRAKALAGSGTIGSGGDIHTDWPEAVRLLEAAVELDPTFTAVWGTMSFVLVQMEWFSVGGSHGELLERAAVAARRAEELDVDHPATRLARAWQLYRTELDYAGAAREAMAALEVTPGDYEATQLVAAMQYRMGRWDDAVLWWRRLIDIEPRNQFAYWTIGQIYRAQRHWPEVWRWVDLWGPLVDEGWRQGRRMTFRLSQAGDTTELRTWLDTALRNVGEEVFHPGDGYIWWFYLRDYAKAVEILDLPQGSRPFFGSQDGPTPKAAIRAWIRHAAGDTVAARADATEAVRFYEENRAAIRPWTWEGRIALPLAILGRREDALRNVAAEVEHWAPDQWIGPVARMNRARVLLVLGDHEVALDEIEDLLQTDYSYGLTVAELRADPRFDPLRGHPRFRRLVEGG